MEFSYLTRQAELKRLDGSSFDVVIVGGGIVGAGIANLLSENKLRILLVDKSDFASGTSSNSSKLIHGGLRYLSQGHLMLTRQLLKERNYLLKNVDIVRRLSFDILVDDTSWKKSSLYFGLLIYNILGGSLALPHFRKDGYSYQGYRGRFTYEDATTNDALLVVYNVVSAVMRGAVAINYMEVTDIRDSDDRVVITLANRFGDGEYRVKSRLVVNSAGPWINAIYGKYRSQRIENLRLSKGSHLILRREKLATEKAIAFRSHIDRRQMFIIPRGEVVIVGTTDMFIDSPESSGISDEERKYIIESVRKVFPSIEENDVVGSYSGVRPLFGSGNDPGKVTRDFHIDMTGKMVSIMGVKITDYRRATRKISRRIGAILGVKLDLKDSPKVIYRRETDDPIRAAISSECALTVDDVLRRRLGSYYEMADQGNSRKSDISVMLSKITGRQGDIVQG